MRWRTRGCPVTFALGLVVALLAGDTHGASAAIPSGLVRCRNRGGRRQTSWACGMVAQALIQALLAEPVAQAR